MRNLETVLKALVDRVSPGDVRLNVPRSAFIREYASYEVSVTTRSYDEGFTGKTIGEAIRSALESLEQSAKIEGDVDPISPSWYRVSRMQREIVEQTLTRCRAEHMALAAAANIAHSSTAAHAEYAMADAFKAALDALFYESNDEEQAPLETEALKPRGERTTVVAKAEEVEANEKRSLKEREARLSATVAELRAKNRERARGAPPAVKR